MPKKSKKQTSKTEAPRKVSAEIIEGPNSATKGSLGLEESFEIQDEFPIESSFRPENSSGSDDSNLSPETEEATTYLPATLPSKELRTRDPLVLYLQEIRKYPVLSKEEEFVLAKKYFETKDPQIAQKLVHSNLRFVVKIAAEYSKFGPKMIDLIQEGNVGLMHAVREYNPYKGARLITYAVWWIRGYIQEFLMRQYSMVRIGTTQNQRKLFYQLQKEKKALDALGVESSTALLSSRLGIPEDEVRDMAMRMSGRDVSLDRPLDEDSGINLGDLQKNSNDLPLDEKIAQEEQIELLRQKIEELRPHLSDREKIILEERILNEDPLTLQEIGEKHGITREAVRQMEARLLKKIKSKMEDGTGG